nr:collagen alpha-1(I) chain-like [Macaca nemestrina]
MSYKLSPGWLVTESDSPDLRKRNLVQPGHFRDLAIRTPPAAAAEPWPRRRRSDPRGWTAPAARKPNPRRRRSSFPPVCTAGAGGRGWAATGPSKGPASGRGLLGAPTCPYSEPGPQTPGPRWTNVARHSRACRGAPEDRARPGPVPRVALTGHGFTRVAGMLRFTSPAGDSLVLPPQPMSTLLALLHSQVNQDSGGAPCCGEAGAGPEGRAGSHVHGGSDWNPSPPPQSFRSSPALSLSGWVF